MQSFATPYSARVLLPHFLFGDWGFTHVFRLACQMMLSMSDEQVVQLLQTAPPQTRQALAAWPRESQPTETLAQARQQQVDRLLSGPPVPDSVQRTRTTPRGTKTNSRIISHGLVLRNYGRE